MTVMASLTLNAVRVSLAAQICLAKAGGLRDINSQHVLADVQRQLGDTMHGLALQ